MAEYRNSIAQDRVQFPIQTIIRPQSGAQFSRVVVYIGEGDESTYLTTSIGAGESVSILSNTYQSETKGALKEHLSAFFAQATTGMVYVVVPQSDDSDLSNTFSETKDLGYFKTALSETQQTALNVALAKLCTGSQEDSQHFVTVSDAITGGNLPTDSLSKALIEGKYYSFVKYHPTTDIAFAQIGKTISTINSTSTPIGNSLDMIGMTGIVASGTDGANLTGTQKNNLDGYKVGYATAVGDGTELVAVEGSMDLAGNSVGADWVKAYITYMCRVGTASYISQGNIFNNSISYIAICSILRDMVSKFETLGRVKDVVFNFPSYSVAVDAGYIKGDKIEIPTAWEATYVDNVREVRIYGTLYVEQPTR